MGGKRSGWENKKVRGEGERGEVGREGGREVGREVGREERREGVEKGNE